ncbi:TBC1 domain family member 23-like isoform X2 [Acanthaster planci]|uniref:TBC1 domain family member 23 n=1 Tax=Acanthaster planci TaxID=133434 RepID=A0A8B7ZVF2_ACAPL|nr:TBC1 domain family member 23-like isoform X2 [Acanthaster planci]
MAECENEDTSWHAELEAALLEGCDFGTLRNICQGRQIPNQYSTTCWKICLNVVGKGDALASFDGIFDLPEQELIRNDCKEFIDEEKLSLSSDLESVITLYCKSKNAKYVHSNGWLDVLGPLVALRMERADLYNCFYAVMSKYVPRDNSKDSKMYQLFRLLLMYHEPQLCNFLDTKKIFPDAYTSVWFSSLFASNCSLEVLQIMWSLYFLQADAFLSFFLGLIILVNAKDHILTELENESREAIAEALASFPNQLEADDVEDFFSLAQYYASKTPQSFRRDYQSIYGSTLSNAKESLSPDLSGALCLQVNPSELLQAIQQGPNDSVSYFVVDCRPAEQYNRCHLATAFHLDADLMLQQPTEFASAVKALFTTQRQAIAAESQAAGEHLCFLGSGREEEDQYLHMVVANFLQKKTQYVSIVAGGFTALLKLIEKESSSSSADQSLKSCIISQPERAGSDDSGIGDSPQKLSEKGAALMGRLTSTFKTKSAEMKDRMVEFIKNEAVNEDRHVSSLDTGKRYRGNKMQNVFSIGDEEEEADSFGSAASSDEERKELVKTDTWLKKPDILAAYQCQEVKDNGHTYPSNMLVTKTHLYVLRDKADSRGFSYIVARRALADVVRITSKKRCPELITFRYGKYSGGGSSEETEVYAVDRLYLPLASEATKLVKRLIMNVLEPPGTGNGTAASADPAT